MKPQREPQKPMYRKEIHLGFLSESNWLVLIYPCFNAGVDISIQQLELWTYCIREQQEYRNTMMVWNKHDGLSLKESKYFNAIVLVILKSLNF